MRRILSAITQPAFDKAFAKLDPDIKRAFIARRNLLFIDNDHPLLNIHKLHGRWSGFFSINVTGDYRAIFKTEGWIAIFFDIGTHADLYDR